MSLKLFKVSMDKSFINFKSNMFFLNLFMAKGELCWFFLHRSQYSWTERSWFLIGPNNIYSTALSSIIWTSTSEVNMMSRMCLENDHGWKKSWLKKKLWLEKNVLVSMCDINLMPTVDVNLMVTVHVIKTFIFYLWLMINWRQLLI